jgi:hypothetical protein
MIKSMSIFALLLGLTLSESTPAHAGETILLPRAREIQLALAAGPEQIRAGATVYVFGKHGYREIRGGTNGFTCLLNRDGNQNGDDYLKPTCWDPEGTRTIVPVVLRVGRLLASSASAARIKHDIDAGFASGKFISPRRTGIAYMLRGDLLFDPKTQRITKTAFPPHYMIYAPGVSNADIGRTISDPPSKFALPAVYAGYSGGTATAYIIVPAAPSGGEPCR